MIFIGMHPRTARKIIENNEELNMAELAEAILEEKKREPKRNHIPSMAKSQAAFHRVQHRKQEEIVWRQRLANVWNKQKHP